MTIKIKPSSMIERKQSGMMFDPELLKRAKLAAMTRDMPLYLFVEEALTEKLEREEQ